MSVSGARVVAIPVVGVSAMPEDPAVGSSADMISDTRFTTAGLLDVGPFPSIAEVHFTCDFRGITVPHMLETRVLSEERLRVLDVHIAGSFTICTICESECVSRLFHNGFQYISIAQGPAGGDGVVVNHLDTGPTSSVSIHITEDASDTAIANMNIIKS